MPKREDQDRTEAPSRPLASLHPDVPYRPQLAAHAPRRLLCRRCSSARARRRFRLRWFRSRKKSGEQAPIEAAAPVEAPEYVAPEPAVAAGQEASSGSTAKPRRRRGSRGGRGRAKKPAASTDAKAEEKKEQPAKPARPDRKPQRRERERPPGKPRRRERERPHQRRRREPPRRAPLPEAKRELVVSVDVGEQRVAVLEDDQVAEVYLERPERRSIAGNIYLGEVDNVLPGMEAAFIEIGLEKNGFLYVDEIVTPELEGKR